MQPGFQFHGNSVCNSFRLVCPDTMRLRTSVNQASGSSLFSFAIWISVATSAQCSPTLPVLDPGNGRTKTGRLWCYAVDNRPWQGPGHPVAAYAYNEDRKAEHPASHLKGFRGLLQVDGYAGFGSLVKAATDGGVQLAFF